MLIANLKSGCLPAPQARLVRRTYFAFDYKYDLPRVQKIRNAPNVIATTVAGFADPSYWEMLNRRGERAVLGEIDDALENTSVTVVCIGQLTAHCRFIEYTIERSLDRGNGVVGIHISHLRDNEGRTEEKGDVPWLIKASGFRVYDYVDTAQLGLRIQEADQISQGLGLESAA